MTDDPLFARADSPSSAALLESLLGSLPVLVAFVDRQRCYLTVSDGLAQFHGFSRNELIGRPVAEVLPDLWPRLESIYVRVFDRGETVSNVELQHLPAGQSQAVCWLANYYPVHAANRIVAAGVILVDITERRRQAAALRESEKRLNYALEAAAEGLWDWNLKTGHTYYSESWIRSLGYEPEDVPSHIDFWQSIVHPLDMPRVRAELEAHFSGKTRLYRCELRLRRKNGDYRWDVCRGKVVEWDAAGAPLRIIGTDTDITERKEAEEALQRLNATLESRVAERTEELAQANRALATRAGELERLLRFRSEFLANMSHELRTPLNSLLILSRMLAENAQGNLTEQQVQYARAIHSSGDDLLKLIDDILNFTRTESGALVLHYEAVRFEEVIAALQQTFGHVAEGRGIAFVAVASPALQESMEADPLRLRQILTNLLANAFKFTERGRIALRIYPAPDTVHGPDMIAFEVSDTGIGIAPDKREVIFEAFRQADAGTNRKYGGTGLGLAISRQLAAAMGGNITVDSDVGRGSTFTVYLPRARKRAASVVEMRVAQEKPVHNTSRDMNETRILVVDDDARNRFSIGAVLESEGYEVMEAESGEAALGLLGRHPEIACALIDVMMPGMDGYETTRRIRADPRFNDLAVIAVTAKAMPEDFQKCIEAGCNEYLAKPIDTKRLLAAVQTLKRKSTM